MTMRRRIWSAVGLLLLAQFNAASAQERTDTTTVPSSMLWDARTIREMPIDNLTDLVNLRSGTFGLFGTDYRYRAGLRGDEAWYLDGVPMNSWLFGLPLFRPPTAGAESVQTVNLPAVSQAGGLTGAVDVRSRVGDDASLDVRVQTDEFIKDLSSGTTRLDAFFDGRLGAGLNFSVAASAQGNRSTQVPGAFKDITRYRYAGVDTVVTVAGPTRQIEIPAYAESDDRIVPYSANDHTSLIGRLDYDRGATDLFVVGTASRQQTRHPFGNACGCAPWNFDAHAGVQVKTMGLIAGVDREVSPRLSIGGRISYQRDRFIDGVLDPDFEEKSRAPSLGFAGNFEFLVDNDAFPIDAQLVENFIRNVDRRTPFDPSNPSLGQRVEFRTNPYGVLSTFTTAGIGGVYTYAEESRVFGTLNARYRRAGHKIGLGVEAATTDMTFGAVQYQNLQNADFFVESPRRFAFYASDRFAVADVTIAAGVRLDRFDPNSTFPVTAGYIDLDNASTLVDAPAQNALGWSLIATLPVAKRHALYAAMVRSNRMVDGRIAFGGKNRDFFRFRNTSTDIVLARPVEHETHSTLEVGGTAALTDGVQLQVGLYQVTAERATHRRTSWEDPTNPGSNTFLRTLELVEVREKGADVAIGSKPGNAVQWRAGYSWIGDNAAFYPGNLLRSDVYAEFSTPNELPSGALDAAHTVSGFVSAPIRIGGRPIVLSSIANASSGMDAVQIRKGWIYSINLRAAHELDVFGRTVRLIADGRDAFSRARVGAVDERVLQQNVDAHRRVLGGGTTVNAVDLSTTNGTTIRNDADLAGLRAAERRFGNGDGIFDANEQNRAFGEAERFFFASRLGADPFARLRLGVEIRF